MHNRKVTAYRITELEAHYDEQRPDIRGIAREDAGF